jgi:hypothetical protein
MKTALHRRGVYLSSWQDGFFEAGFWRGAQKCVCRQAVLSGGRTAFIAQHPGGNMSHVKQDPPPLDMAIWKWIFGCLVVILIGALAFIGILTDNTLEILVNLLRVLLGTFPHVN